MKTHFILMGMAILISLILAGCAPPDPEQLIGFWKIDQVFFWDEAHSKWVQDTTAKPFYNEFKRGGANCPRSEGNTYVMFIPSQTCYLVDQNLLVERSSSILKEYQWVVRGNSLEILSQMILEDGNKVKVKTISVRASKEDAFKDGFPYTNPLQVEEVIK